MIRPFVVPAVSLFVSIGLAAAQAQAAGGSCDEGAVDGEACAYASEPCLPGVCEDEDGLAFVGFTAATAAGFATHDVLSWTMDSGTPGAPEIDYDDFAPGDDLHLLDDAVYASGDIRLVDNLNHRGAMWHRRLQPVTEGFDTQFSFRIFGGGGVGYGDGMAFVIQRDARGLEAIGDYGQAIGYGSFVSANPAITNSLAVELDPFYNGLGEPVMPHVSVQTAFAGPNSSVHSASLGSVEWPAFANGAPHTLRIVYLPAPANELSIYLDGSGTAALTVAVDLADLVLERISCDATEEVPAEGCMEASVSSLSMKNGETDQLKLKWSGGPAFDKQDVGDPTAGADYALCLYSAASALLADAVVDGSHSCGAKPCWKETPPGYKYKDKAASQGGVSGVAISAGAEGATRMSVKAGGEAFAELPAGALAAPITAQLVQPGGGLCFSTTFANDDISRNDGVLFKARNK